MGGQVEAARKEAGPAAPAAKASKRSWVGWLMGEPSPPQGTKPSAGEEGDGDAELRSDLTPEEVAELQELAAEQQSAMASGNLPFCIISENLESASRFETRNGGQGIV